MKNGCIKPMILRLIHECIFFDSASGMFYYTHNQHSNLIARKMEIADNVIPSSNSEMAKIFIQKISE